MSYDQSQVLSFLMQFTFPMATPFPFSNPLDLAPILFVTSYAGISTGIAHGGVCCASLMLVASETPGQPWFLLKTDGLIFV
ncbi:hypothetical protein BKA82DRAFT_26394 [Pisolithus tinctorius]|uniref:Uncharacterized protein n=1 Tax=Pisolithus tinctorius Marx 270 TaxID=870435 RepID=A0A0C3P9G4_PISTI|nr:hypothetical protein BKA82DRAFT_26394 [Pisolithus tinctorius]KIO04184.1 hypothetical protein M404DRAFT_26394 [Pisolithus tinctorius Marx 270]